MVIAQKGSCGRKRHFRGVWSHDRTSEETLHNTEFNCFVYPFRPQYSFLFKTGLNTTRQVREWVTRSVCRLRISHERYPVDSYSLSQRLQYLGYKITPPSAIRLLVSIPNKKLILWKHTVNVKDNVRWGTLLHLLY